MEIEVAVHDAARAVLEAAGVEAATLRVVDVDFCGAGAGGGGLSVQKQTVCCLNKTLTNMLLKQKSIAYLCLKHCFCSV